MVDETVADYDIRSPASRTLLTVIGTLLAVALLAGLVLGASILARDTKVTTSVVELGSSALIVLDAGFADVRVVEGDDDVVKISSAITSGLRETPYVLGRRGDRLKIASGCQSWLNPGCGVSTTIEVPKGLPVEVRTSSGNVTADGIEQGVLTIKTGSGDILAKRLGVDELSAKTSTGDIRASFAAQPFALKATTTSGDISAMVPSGKRSYAVTATSKSGTVRSGIESDTDGTGFIRASSGSGDISLDTP